MSRAVFLDMSRRAVIEQCELNGVGISSIEEVTGGIRLVCMSVAGSVAIREKLQAKVMKDDAERQQRGSGWGFVPRT